MEPVYATVVGVARTMFAVQGTRFTMTGLEHLPRTGGAVLAMNHVGFLDFTYAGLAGRRRGRWVRFMAKAEVFGHPVAGPLMRGMHHIPVDRTAGAGSFAAATEALRRGEVVGVFPEGTISSSFELSAFRSGAARLAIDAGVPLVPTVLWGSQRVWTKRTPRRLGRHRVPISVDLGAPVDTAGTAHEVTARLHAVMTDQLAAVVARYPEAPAGAPWLPARLGGSAPTPEQARAQDRADAQGRVAARREGARARPTVRGRVRDRLSRR